jgi:8-amino-3,8-dideoxy-alpha-D-manno-octulosonate transaminase
MPGFEIIGNEEKEEIMDVLSRKILFRYEFDQQRQGIYKVEAFEKSFAQYCNAEYALALSSGSTALKVALASLGIGPGDEVITQGFTFVATWEAILDIGAIPIFAEIDESFCLDPNDIESRINERTKAIMPVHMCGAQAKIQEIVEIANRHHIPVIEDTAQSCGGRINGQALGTFGQIGTFSFDSVKTITTGEGGMLITNDKDLYINASEYHDHGHDHDPEQPRGLEKRRFIGFNYRMMELQGALGLAQLGKLEKIILPRQKENKKQIKDTLQKLDQVTFRYLVDPEGDTATFLIFLLPDAEKARTFQHILVEQKAPCVYWYENTWHYFEQWEHLLGKKSLQNYGYPFLNKNGTSRASYSPKDLPLTAEIMARALTIPISINMDDQLPVILKAIEKAAAIL